MCAVAHLAVFVKLGVMAVLLKGDNFWGIKINQQGTKHSCYMGGESTFYLRQSEAATVTLMWLKLTNIISNVEYASYDTMTIWGRFFF